MNKKKQEQIVQKFSKKQIINSKKYCKYRDMLMAILKENTSYSTEKVEQKIKDFMKRKV